MALNCGLDSATTVRVCEAFIETLKQAYASGETVSLTGFGTFAPKHTPQRQGRNPHSGDSVTIPAATKLDFKPSQTLRITENVEEE